MKFQKQCRPPKSPSNLLSAPKEASAVSVGGEGGGRRSVRGRLRRRTAGIALLLCVAVLLLAVGSGNHTSLPSHMASYVAAWIGNVEFMNLSGKESQTTGKDLSSSDVQQGVLLPDYTAESENTESQTTEKESETILPSSRPIWNLENLYQFDAQKVPDGETPILPMDLSLSSLGAEYINNATGLKPDVKKLLAKPFGSDSSLVALSKKNKPLVLVLHTHGTEGYSEDGALSFSDNGGEIARSEDPRENVVAVGAAFSEALNQAGIPTLHCTVMHDQTQYKDSYSRAKQTVERYLSAYPSIRLVIDLHRDSIVKSSGELVRPVTLVDGEVAAQVMCVVGSNWNGQENPRWEENLSLALKLRKALNEQYEKFCRPVYLKGSTYNQELAPYSLLLEIGAGGNSVEEAKRAAVKVAETLAQWIPML